MNPGGPVLQWLAGIDPTDLAAFARTRVHEGGIGLADFLEEEDLVPSDIMHYCEEADLFVIPAGRAVENPTDLLTREKFLSLLGTMAETFDYVILDSPPIIPVTDTFLLSEICDHTLYVVRHKYTPKAVLDSLATNSKVKRLKNVSVVFNSIRARGYVKSAYGYMKGYGNEYLYGQVRTVVSNKSENDKTPAK